MKRKPLHPMRRKMTPAEWSALLNPATAAMLRMRLGNESDGDRDTLACCINVAHILATRVQRHRGHLADIAHGAAAAAAGWCDLNAIDNAVELFKAIAKTVDRKMLLAAYVQAVGDATSHGNNYADLPRCIPIGGQGQHCDGDISA